MQVADDLLQLVLVVLAIHVLLGGQKRVDALRNDHVELAALVFVAHENHVQQVPLVVAQQVVHDLRAVLVHIDKQPRKVIQRDVVLLALHDGLDLDAVQDGAVHVEVHAEVLDLHDAFVFRVVDLRLEVDEPDEVEVQNGHLRQAWWHRKLGLGRVLVDHRCE